MATDMFPTAISILAMLGLWGIFWVRRWQPSLARTAAWLPAAGEMQATARWLKAVNWNGDDEEAAEQGKPKPPTPAAGQGA